MDVRFLLGKRVRYRGRIGTVVSQLAITDAMARSVTIRVADGSESVVPSLLWPWVEFEDEGDVPAWSARAISASPGRTQPALCTVARGVRAARPEHDGSMTSASVMTTCKVARR